MIAHYMGSIQQIKGHLEYFKHGSKSEYCRDVVDCEEQRNWRFEDQLHRHHLHSIK
jgi:hypothetical protein